MTRMKLYISLIIAVLMVSFCACQKEDYSYVVSGKLNNINDSIFFSVRESGDSLAIDTIRLNQKGEFSFTGSVDTLTVISLYFRNNAASPYVLVDKGWKVEVGGDIDYPDLIEVKGGEVNNELTKFKKANADLLATRRDLIKAQVSKEKAAAEEPKTADIELKNVDFNLKNIVSDYIKNNPTKISSVILLDSFFKNEESLERLNEGLGVLEGIAQDFPLSAQLRSYRDHIQKSAVNSMAPSFSLKDKEGRTITLTDYKDKYLLVSFMSSTCSDCNEILPDLIKVYEKIKKDKKNLEFVSFVKDVEELGVADSDLKNVKWTTIPVDGGWGAQIFEDYNINEVPYLVLISTEGRILERDLQIFNLDARLDAYPDMKEKPKAKNKYTTRNK